MFVLVLMAAGMGQCLFFQSGYSQNPYLNMDTSVWSSFIFVITADNYPDELSTPFAENLLYSGYFILFSVIGLFLVVSLLIAVFQTK